MTALRGLKGGSGWDGGWVVEETLLSLAPRAVSASTNAVGLVTINSGFEGRREVGRKSLSVAFLRVCPGELAGARMVGAVGAH